MRSVTKSLIRGAAAVAGPHRWPRSTPRLWILMYHRILPIDDPRAQREEPGMRVTPETFRRHVQWLRQSFEVVRLSEWVARAAMGDSLPRRACAITFDDGWRDNHQYAWPVLAETGLPATVFVVSHMVGTNEVFWPNRLARLLGLGRQARHAMGWLPAAARPPGDRPLCPEILTRAIAACKQFTDEDLQARLDEAEALVAQEAGVWDAELLSWDELRELADSGLVEVGSHTCWHTRLNGETSFETTAREIRESQALLEKHLERAVRLFCYPNGDSSPDAAELVRQHYDAAVTTQRGINTAATPRHALMRIGVHEDVSATRRDFFARLSGWV